jgi:Tfp pilus assembly protein PilF
MGKRLVWPAALLVCASCTMFAERPVTASKVAIGMHSPDIQPIAHREEVPTRDPLQAASRCLDSGDDAGATTHLCEYLEKKPQHAAIRAHLAELLMRQNRLTEAKLQFTEYLVLAQQQGSPADRHLLLCHTRLTELARCEGDEYGEHLYRGIGLWQLAKQAERSDVETELEPQQLYIKATKELKKAIEIRSDDARPYWYLHEVWCALGQRHPARQALHQAKEFAAISSLTPAEQQDLARTP